MRMQERVRKRRLIGGSCTVHTKFLSAATTSFWRLQCRIGVIFGRRRPRQFHREMWVLDGATQGARHHLSLTIVDRSKASAPYAARRSRKALPMTETELKLIARAAIIGLRSKPKAG